MQTEQIDSASFARKCAARPEAVSIDPALGHLPHKAAVFEIVCLEELGRARDIREFKTKITALIARFGFTDFSYIRMLARDAETQLITTERQMTDFWLGEALWEHDLLTQYASVNNLPIYQSTIDEWVNSAPFETLTTSKNKQLQNVVKGFGYLDYYNIPLRAGNGNGNVLLSITSRHMERAEFQRRIMRARFGLRVLARAIDHVGTAKFSPYILDSTESQQIALRPRSLELLNVLATCNVTVGDAAEMLGWSEVNAKRHIAAFKAALGARTIAGAVYRAIKAGLVEC